MGTPVIARSEVTHRPLMASPPQLMTLTPVGEPQANETNWKGGGPADSQSAPWPG